MIPGSLLPFQPQAGTLTYEGFFGLKEKAFSLNSDERFLFHSPSHAASFENLLAGIRRREGLLVVTGEIGVGKTTLCHAVLKNLGRTTFSSFVSDPFVSREDLLKMLLIDFGVLSIDDLTTGPLKHATRTELGYLLSGFLESLAALDAFVVVIIDEAQNMSLSLIEETRILSDSFGARGRLQIVFIGQPELHAKLKLPEMRQVDQRICGYCHLEPLNRDDVAGYVQHRLQVAGGSRARVLFPPDVLDIIHRRSGGVPRLISRICDRALHLAHLRKAPSIDITILEAALTDIGSSTLAPTWASIVFPPPEPMAQSLVPSATPVPAVETPPAEASTPATGVPPQPHVATAPTEEAKLPRDDEDSFSRRIEEWMTQELEPTFRKATPLPRAALEIPELPAPQRPIPRDAFVRRAVPTQTSWRDLQGELRSETYVHRVVRVWARRVATAGVCVAALATVVAGVSLIPERLAGPMMASADLPALPAAPTFAVSGLVPPATPPVEAPQPAVSGDYLVAVALFASRERADRLVEDLTQAGLPAVQRPFQLRRQSLRQVVLGPFVNRSDAVMELQRLRQLGGYDDARVFDTLPQRTVP